jgi:hypothetical protein
VQLLAIPVLPKAEMVAPVMIFCEGSITQLSVGLQASLFILDMKEAASYNEVSKYFTKGILLVLTSSCFKEVTGQVTLRGH